MRHVILTCRNHTNLRWSVKACACNEGGKPGDPSLYNHTRRISYCGTPTGQGMFSDGSGLDCMWTEPECACPATDLIIAPEDPLVKREM